MFVNCKSYTVDENWNKVVDRGQRIKPPPQYRKETAWHRRSDKMAEDYKIAERDRRSFRETYKYPDAFNHIGIAYNKVKMVVYILSKDGRIVYVGQTKNLASRILAHRAGRKEFDSVRYIIVENERDQHSLEAALIHMIKPIYNKTGFGMRKSTNFILNKYCPSVFSLAKPGEGK
jgi:hypothetical protein